MTREKAEIAADFMTIFYHLQIGTLETQWFRTQPVPFWLGHDQRAIATNVFCRSAAGWDGCCAERGEAVVVNGAKRDDLT